MKMIKKGIGLTLLLVIAMSVFSGCAFKKDGFSHEKIKDIAKEYKLDEYDYDELDIESVDSEGFYSATNDSDEDMDVAQYCYNNYINRFMDMYQYYGAYQVDEFSFLSVGEDSKNFVYLLTFEREKSAKKFFDNFTLNEDTGKEKEYKYAYDSVNVYDGGLWVQATYIKGDKVLIIRSTTGDLETFEELCDELDVVFPFD